MAHGVQRGSKARWVQHTSGQLEAGGTDLGDGSGCGSFLQKRNRELVDTHFWQPHGISSSLGMGTSLGTF